MARKFGAKQGECPVAEQVSDCLLRLPLYSDMTETEQSWVVSTLMEFNASRPRC